MQASDPESGGFNFAYGSGGTGCGRFAHPSGLAIDGLRLHITDRENGRVQIWTC